MQNLNKISILAFLFFSGHSLAMEQDPSKKSPSKVSLERQTNAQVPLLVDQCTKAVADRLAKDLIEQKDYTVWFNSEKIPAEMQYNILKYLCKYHSDIV